MKKYICLLFILNISVCSGQISIGKKDKIFSQILNENRELWIYIPESANDNPKQKFPVIYLLDGETYFHSFTGAVSHLSEINGNAIIPDMIVVGIINTTRSLDLSPTKDTSSNLQPNGGGENFTLFIEKELIPYIESKYSIAPYSMLVGHSLGGIFTINTLLKHTAIFNSYLALDPSFDWDKKKLISESEILLQTSDLKDKTLFMGGSSLCIESNKEFEDILMKSNAQGLRRSFKYYKEESHGSVPLIASYDGLRFIFNFYKRPSFVSITDSSSQVLSEHYEIVSKKMGYTIPPPENLLLGLAWRCRVLEKNYSRALQFLKIAEKYYPESPDVNTGLVDLFTDMGDHQKAKHYREKVANN